MGKCHACKREYYEHALNECMSSCLSKTEYYCRECLDNFIESYDDLIEYCLNLPTEEGLNYMTHFPFSDRFKSTILNNTLKYNNKSFEDFNNDIIKKMEERANEDQENQEDNTVGE